MKVFKAKVGYEILIPVLLILVATVVFPTYNTGEIVAGLITSAIVLPVIFVVLNMFLKTTYSIDREGQLHIKCGFIFKSIVSINQITSIKKTNNLLSAPSLDRIKIFYRKYGWVMISPKDKIAFVKEFLKINPNIKTFIIQPS